MMSKFVTIEVRDNFDHAMTYTLVGVSNLSTLNTFTNCAVLSKGTTFVLDQEKLKNGSIYHIQK